MRIERVLRDAKHHGTPVELGVLIADAFGFNRATRGIVLRVEIDDERLSLELAQMRDRTVLSRRR